MRSYRQSTKHRAWRHHELNQHSSLPFLIHTPKGPQNKSFSADFTDLENQAPSKEGGLIPSTPEEHLKKCIGAMAADAGDGLSRGEPGLAPAHHPPSLLANCMRGLNDWADFRAVPRPHALSLVPCLLRSTYLHTFTSGTRITSCVTWLLQMTV